jgi:inosose dehydratase
MDEIVEAEYEWIELGPYGYLPTNINQLRDELDKRNLKVSGTFVMGDLTDPSGWPNVEQQLLGAGENLAALGAPYLVLIDDVYTDLFTNEPLRPDQLNGDQWQRLFDTAHRVATIARDQFGLKVVFHPHAETHVETEEQIERFLDNTDPALLPLCLDTGHHEYRGGDSIRFLADHHDRIDYLHLKSVDGELRDRVNRENIPFGKAVGMDLFCDLAEGTVDFPALAALLKKIDFTGFAIVEQDMFPCPFDKPLPIAKRNRQYLREAGIG